MSVNIYLFVVFLVRIVANCDLCLIREPEPSSPPGCRPPGARAEGDGRRNERQIRGPRQRAVGGPDALGCGGAGGELREQPTVTRSPWYPAEGDWLSGRAPRSHRGGHWFDPSIAHPAQRPVPIVGPAVFDLGAAALISAAVAPDVSCPATGRASGARRGWQPRVPRCLTGCPGVFQAPAGLIDAPPAALRAAARRSSGRRRTSSASNATGRRPLSRLGGKRDVKRRSLPGGTGHVNRPPERFDAVGEAHESRTTGGVGPASAVVTD